MLAEKDKMGSGASYSSLIERAEEAKLHTQRIKDILLGIEKFVENTEDLRLSRGGE